MGDSVEVVIVDPARKKYDKQETPQSRNTANRNNCRLLCHLLVILKVIFANNVDPDLGPHCLYAEIGLKSLHEYSADDITQTTFSDVGFLGILRVNT